MHLPPPLGRDIVLLGGGHAHALVLRMWGMAPPPGLRLTLINPDPVAAYSGMLPGFVAGHYRQEEAEIDLVRLARFAGARLILARATGIDRAAGLVQVEGRGPVGYDLLSVDIGVTSDLPCIAGFAGHGLPAKPLGAFAAGWSAFVAKVAAGQAAPEVAVIGAGLAGVELAFAARHRLGAGARVTLVEATATPLAAVGRRARGRLLAALARDGITLVTGQAAVAVQPDGVRLADGRLLPAALTIGAAGAAAAGWLADSGLALEGGFVRVRPTLQSDSDPAIFAAGDVAHLTHAPRPKAGVFAVRAAPVLFHNLCAAATGGALRDFRPQGDYLKLVSTGGRRAVADKSGLAAEGAAIWRWKDRIDRAFIARLADLPAMAAPAGPDTGDKPLCGGCGAKVGGATLAEALAHLPAPTRADIETGAGDDAAVLRMGATRQVLTTDHLRAFTLDPCLMARITAIHALGDVWSMGAAPQAALAQIILPPLSDRLQSRTLAEIMAVATEVFAAEGAAIVGGHTSQGAELSIGFTVTGLCDGPALTHAGARAGDRLILTKPIGTGVILAAEMAGRARAQVVAGALASMCRPQGAAARLMAPLAHAMTDVTGFGLAGHLLAILRASGTGAVLRMADVPFLPGALDLSRMGEGSSLLPANRQVRADMLVTEGPDTDLLFDPQTAGGLLAAVPADQADALLAHLLAAGEAAAIIGEVIDGPPHASVL